MCLSVQSLGSALLAGGWAGSVADEQPDATEVDECAVIDELDAASGQEHRFNDVVDDIVDFELLVGCTARGQTVDPVLGKRESFFDHKQMPASLVGCHSDGVKSRHGAGATLGLVETLDDLGLHCGSMGIEDRLSGGGEPRGVVVGVVAPEKASDQVRMVGDLLEESQFALSGGDHDREWFGRAGRAEGRIHGPVDGSVLLLLRFVVEGEVSLRCVPFVRRFDLEGEAVGGHLDESVSLALEELGAVAVEHENSMPRMASEAFEELTGREGAVDDDLLFDGEGQPEDTGIVRGSQDCQTASFLGAALDAKLGTFEQASDAARHLRSPPRPGDVESPFYQRPQVRFGLGVRGRWLGDRHEDRDCRLSGEPGQLQHLRLVESIAARWLGSARCHGLASWVVSGLQSDLLSAGL